jgi:hypothetical protein
MLMCAGLVYAGDFEHLTTWSVFVQALVFAAVLLAHLFSKGRVKHALFIWIVPSTAAMVWSVAVSITFVIHRRIRALVHENNICALDPTELALFSTYHALAHYAPIAFFALITLWYQRNYSLSVRDACQRVGYIPYVFMVVGLSQIVPVWYDAVKDTSTVYFGADHRVIGVVFQVTSVLYVVFITRFTCHPGTSPPEVDLKRMRVAPCWFQGVQDPNDVNNRSQLIFSRRS